jgi:histidine triad (HIT) family protein
MDCIFCKIGVKEIPSQMIYEDEHAFAILDITPRAPGHAMVMPKLHAATILELPESEIGPLFSAVKAVTAKLEKVMKPDGFTIGINHGDASGQTVKHLHVHVIPRWKNDGGGSIHSVVSNQPQEEIADIARRLNEP